MNISDIDRNYFHDHKLTIARHPSENDVRMMARLVAFALNAYSGNSANAWWKKIHADVGRFKNLSVINLPVDAIQEMAALAQRAMDFPCTIQEGEVWISGKDKTVRICPVWWKKREK